MPILTLKKHNEIYKIPFAGAPLLKDLLEKSGVIFASPCGGKGKCGKCAVEISGDVSKPDEKEKELNCRLACRTVLYGDACAELLFCEDFVFDNITVNGLQTVKQLYAAVDVGTTTVVLELFDGEGRCISQVSALNPQRSVSLDVMGRISASLNGKKELLKNQINTCITTLLKDACNNADIDRSKIRNMVITGNTAMLYFLCGYDAKSIAVSPFSADCLFGFNIDSSMNIYLPPCISAFCGGDMLCSIIASGMYSQNQTCLLCDIGTNGEIALFKNGKLYVTSAAAGPAFEGAEIKCGCGYVSGAVKAVYSEKGKIIVDTVNNQSPVGICGSGLIDAISLFCELGYIDENGKISSDLILAPNVYITQEDISSLQYAKSAIYSAIEILLAQTETNMNDIKAFYLAGSFGGGINITTAAKIGLFPKEFINITSYIGNGALIGAKAFVFDKELQETAKDIAKNAHYVSLGGNEDFNKAFIRNINFPKV